ncbi:hypothetical protein [Marinobacterium stanieri]|uniref:Uncharacterized protein n=1 Tax=Marinobacterium stanieri TaxID=49186 RepID=A0A1N6Q0B3_9GAMM|nr:hypothetical protein [Marinobacterium stanieri]SIQ09975.1 hypothetical protein SAMN05421647_102160 [Marinobacterium stanieri]
MRYDDINVEFIDHLIDTFKMLALPYYWKLSVILTIPTILVFHTNSGFLFIILMVGSCLYARSARLGGLIGWYLVTLTLLLYYSAPEAGHFIELLLRAPARNSSPSISSQDVLSAIPETWDYRLFWALVFGLRGGFIIGLGPGMLGRMLWGYNPRVTQ